MGCVAWLGPAAFTASCRVAAVAAAFPGSGFHEAPAAFAQHASSDVMPINANQAGFTACLLCGAEGRVALGPPVISGWGGGLGDLEDVGRDKPAEVRAAE